MNKKNAYIYFSSATDVTGQKLADALGIKGINGGKDGKIKPPTSAELVIGWGVKTNDSVLFNKGVVIVNHPDNIRDNRNKFGALEKMSAAGVSISEFQEATAKFTIPFPVIGRTKYHQGGKGFWVCPTPTHVNDAIKEGANYFQHMIEIKDEFRLHVFGEDIIYAVKKVKRTKEEFEKAFIEDELARQKKLWAKNNEGDFNEEQALSFLKRQAKNAAAGGANMMVRSNKMGWKFSRIQKIEPKLHEEAVKAIKALGLSFGAVDCCIDADNKPFIIEVNTGPGLEGTPFDCYVEAFKKVLNVKEAPAAPIAKKAPAVGKAKTAASAISVEAGVLKDQVSRLQGALESCDDPSELAALKRLGSVIFGGQ